VAFVVGSTFVVRSNLQDVTELNLTNYLQIVASDYESGHDSASIIEKYAAIDQYLRITLIDENGNVLADSLSNTTENHLARPEFAAPGTTFIRYSDTLDREMMYLAMVLSDGNFLRVAIPTSSILPFLNAFIGVSVLIALVIAILSGIGSFFLAKQVLDPLKQTAETLNDISQGKYIEKLPLEKTEEMNRLINEINDISKLISRSIRSLNVEKQKSDLILDHMDQGLCVLDFSGRIVMINRFVKELFAFNEQENENKDYRFLFRDKTIQNAVRTVLQENKSTTAMFFVSDRYYSITASPIENDWNQSRSVIVIITDITMIKDLEIQKRDFFLNASHELKSPLTSIIGASDLIANGLTKDEAESIDLAKRIVQEANRMNNLVMDMLNLSKYENHLLSKGDQIVDLAEVVLDVAKKLEPTAAERGIRIETDLKPVEILAEYEHMIQLVRNLVDNSVKYGVENGHVIVKLYPTAETFNLEITDDGIGIPKMDQSRIFERFYRVDKARSKKTGGTGLGLSIVKHICLLYRANIELESELGKGTKITIRFPKE
jgi:two-component system phosphate regulon sensor histidine kinase PhoR